MFLAAKRRVSDSPNAADLSNGPRHDKSGFAEDGRHSLECLEGRHQRKDEDELLEISV